MARVLIGPDGGPYVELDEVNGDLNITTPNGTIDFTGDSLTNGDLSNLTGDVTGLTGDLADPQDPKTHSTTHESGGSDTIDSGSLAANSEFQIYTTTTDPTSPAVGTIWYRSDLD